MAMPGKLQAVIEKLTPRQRQWAMLGGIAAAGMGALFLVFALTSSTKPVNTSAGNGGRDATVTNVEVMPGGAQVTPVDQWVGTAGKKLDQYEQERDRQAKLNADNQAFEERTLKRFAELEQKLTAVQQTPPAVPAPPPPAPETPAAYPPSRALTAGRALPPPPLAAESERPPPEPVVPPLVRVAVSEVPPRATPGLAGKVSAAPDSVDNFLPVSFTRGILLGGLDAPTGGQAQANPQPVLIRLEDNAVLPNRFRSQVKECFIIAAGYGDISSERAYLRTENLSCVRHDGTTLEAKIQGSVFGEDGKNGMRGRLVTKEGQVLAKALLAGFMSGMGSGLAQQSSTLSVSPLGATQSVEPGKIFQYGAYNGVGRAMDRLAQYYVSQLDKIFPVIEIDAGRAVDVVITKGVRIDLAAGGVQDRPAAAVSSRDGNERIRRVSDDDDY
jgi:conjugal transfer pilus assembly protein TraB